MLKKLYPARFEIFLLSQSAVLFGSLLMPIVFYESVLMPLLFLANIIAGILLISKRKKLVWFFIILFTGAAFAFGSGMMQRMLTDTVQIGRIIIYFLFHAVVAVEIIKQVWKAKLVSKNVIFGLMSGYISLGFIAFFIFMTIELFYPGSFQGIFMDQNEMVLRMDSIMYYGYITLMTIGYGDIVPITPIAQKAAILVGLMGQFYLVIIMAVVVSKYIRHSME